MGGRYRPPALRALASGGSPPNEVSPSIPSPADATALPPTNYPPGFRRARAGTLPSNVQLAAQRFAAASNTLGSTPPSTDSLTEQTPRQIPNAPAPAPAVAAPARPGLRHATSVASTAASTATAERNSRLRSGSLTLPTGGLSNAFGPSIFSSSWLSTTNGSGNGFPVLDELRSVTSADSGADDFDVHTLDYLGLDDHRTDPRNDPRNQPQAATLSELRNQAQAAIAGNLANPSRMRASTVSNPYRNRPAAAAGSLLPTPAAEEEEEYFDGYEEIAYTRQRLNSYETSIPDGGFSSSAYVAKGFKATDHLSTIRPRAISVSGLDDPMRTLQRRATVADVSPYVNDLNQQNSGLSVLASNAGGPAGILKSLASARGGSSPNVHFPGAEGTGRGVSQYLLAPSAQNRSLSPKSEGPSSQTQTPTRSLWIGNLDSAVTSEQLIHVFAPYGAIESLRLLPEKVCTSVKSKCTY